MERPQILLVPTATEVEWTIKPQLEEWAEVASFDLPGVGGEPKPDALSPEAIAERGIAEIERQGWRRCVVVGDEVGAAQAVRLAAMRPDLVAGLAIGHPALSFSREGDRPAFDGAVLEAFIQVARTDYRSYVRALAQATQHAYDEDFVQEYMRRVPEDLAADYMELLMVRSEDENLEPMLRSLDVPLLFVEHKGCLMWTRESFEDAVKAFPDARTASMQLKPSVNPEFAELLRDFCAKLPSPSVADASTD
jgi:pimeloyl-ACP methyl ester carboxylesterase